MFEDARVKLTTWYLLIIMTISLVFSAFIYKSVTSEFKRRLNVIEKRLETNVPKEWKVSRPIHDFFLEDLKLARKKVLFILLYANGTIFLLSAAAGYYLAGKTLQPIEVSMEEQKRFVADASHELRTPLTALQTSIEVALRDDELGLKDARKILKESLDDVENLSSLSNNLLTLTRMQSNGRSLNYYEIEIKGVAESVVKKFIPLAKKKGVGLKLKAGKQKMRADKQSIENLITILVDNAIKYTKKGGKVTISIAKVGKYLEIKIKDTGVGISKKDLPHVFERFYRADSSRSKIKADGFGLGLSIAKRIAELHKGTIRVESKVGKGSTFIVKLPLF